MLLNAIIVTPLINCHYWMIQGNKSDSDSDSSSSKIKETAYKAYIYVRPKMEYISSIWDPHTKKDIKKIDMV